jgi:hypothetical protein
MKSEENRDFSTGVGSSPVEVWTIAAEPVARFPPVVVESLEFDDVLVVPATGP